MSCLRNLAPQIAALLLGASASVGSFAQATLKFGEGAGEVTLPAHYAQVEDRDASLVVLSKPEGNVKLYFDLHKLDVDAAAHIANPGQVSRFHD